MQENLLNTYYYFKYLPIDYNIMDKLCFIIKE